MIKMKKAEIELTKEEVKTIIKGLGFITIRDWRIFTINADAIELKFYNQRVIEQNIAKGIIKKLNQNIKLKIKG